MSSEREPFVGRQSSPSESPAQATTGTALYHDSSQSPQARMCQLLFVALVVVMVLISISLSIYRGTAVEENGFMYFMLGVNLIGFAVLEIIMIMFVRRGDLPKGKTWFLYFVGGAVILESIFTDVALFR
ncbi:hypothetical protein BaRGS_00001145 [Batillaria attramentaria]|uniref:Uncharacterized protein n=1 Tax=Batillaria attramentaria TaxID=370345 RepID=A0ABD0M6U0_9CAEN